MEKTAKDTISADHDKEQVQEESVAHLSRSCDDKPLQTPTSNFDFERDCLGNFSHETNSSDSDQATSVIQERKRADGEGFSVKSDPSGVIEEAGLLWNTNGCCSPAADSSPGLGLLREEPGGCRPKSRSTNI